MKAGCWWMENSKLQAINSSVKIRTYRYLKFALQIFSNNSSFSFFILYCVCSFFSSLSMLVTLLHFILSIAPYGIHYFSSHKYGPFLPALNILAHFLFYPCCRSNPQPIFVSQHVSYVTLYLYLYALFHTYSYILGSRDRRETVRSELAQRSDSRRLVLTEE